MQIIPAREHVLLSAVTSKQFFLMDPKTTAILRKFNSEASVGSAVAYYPRAQQIISSQIDKSFASFWDLDSSDPLLPISLNEILSSLNISTDHRLLFGGMKSGNLLVWEIPSGLLLRKRHIHSSNTAGVLGVFEMAKGYLLTVASNQVKMWAMSSLLFEGDIQVTKVYQSPTTILKTQVEGTQAVLLSEKSVTILQCEPTTAGREFELLSKIDFERACSLCLSPSEAYVGCFEGTVEVLGLDPTALQFMGVKLKDRHLLSVDHIKQRRKLLSGHKHPVTALGFVRTLGYLIGGNSQGTITIWWNGEIQKSISLFKTSVQCILVMDKPSSPASKSKIKALHKYQNSKSGELLQIIRGEREPDCEQGGEKDSILRNMLSVVQGKELRMAEKLQRLNVEKQQLVTANLHYCRMLMDS